MKIEINEDIIKAATKCEKGFSCLSDNLEESCKVEYCVSNTVYFVKCLSAAHCSYKEPFGEGYFCTCPIRKEIYDKYKK